MRIAILTNAFPPDGRGGAERIAYMQADGFGVFGHEVRVYAPTTADAWSSETLHGVEIERFPSKFGRLSEMSASRRLAYHLFSDRKPRRDVAERINAWKPDVLLTHNLTGCGIGTARSVQSNGVRWIHTLHDIQLTDPSGQETVAPSKTAQARVWRAFWSAWRRRTFGVPDVVVSPTRWLLDWHFLHGIPGRGARRAPRNAEARSSGRTPCAPTGIIIPNPVIMSAPRDRLLRRPAMIAYVGRLSADKGFDEFLDALKRLDATVVSRAVVVGDGPMASVARDMADHRLELRGVLSPEDARRAIADADLLIAPSRILENQQTIIVEAMAEGTPVVASDTGGTK
ncbi:MAG TPA: glycosyltransferase, partial [Candidatus Methylomirabilis sp.]|nr:glycosyltransferase [Candidatus Methylomirabilis sp.]